MMPGSHERGYGPECRCGANWDRWNDRCVTEPIDDGLAGAAEEPTS